MLHIPPSTPAFFEEYKKVLQSGQERKIRAFCARYGINPPPDAAGLKLAAYRAVERMESAPPMKRKGRK